MLYFRRTGETLLWVYSGTTVPEEQFTRKYSFFKKNTSLNCGGRASREKRKWISMSSRRLSANWGLGKPTNHDTGGLWHVVLAVWRTAFPLRSLCQVMLFVNISQFGILKKKTRKYLDLNILASVGWVTYGLNMRPGGMRINGWRVEGELSLLRTVRVEHLRFWTSSAKREVQRIVRGWPPWVRCIP